MVNMRLKALMSALQDQGQVPPSGEFPEQQLDAPVPAWVNNTPEGKPTGLQQQVGTPGAPTSGMKASYWDIPKTQDKYTGDQAYEKILADMRNPYSGWMTRKGSLGQSSQLYNYENMSKMTPRQSTDIAKSHDEWMRNNPQPQREEWYDDFMNGVTGIEDGKFFNKKKKGKK